MLNILDDLARAQHKSGFGIHRIIRPKNWLNWEYWRYRIMRPIIKMRYNAFRKKHYPSPWLSPAATLFLDKWITKEMVGAEFGSGLSTVFFAQRTQKMVSVEHFEPWFQKVRLLFKEQHIQNVDYLFIPKGKESEIKLEQRSEEKHLIEKYNYEMNWPYTSYFTALTKYPNDYFDFIIVDGRARPECIFSSIDKLTSGGLMILDNSERPRYAIVFEALMAWKSFTTSNGLTDTTFWIKP